MLTRRLLSVSLAWILMCALTGCATPASNGITQISTFDALQSGDYSGHMSLATLRQYGDFGLGTFERLDGEMILLGGKFYQLQTDGKIYQPPLSAQTPFACVTQFVADRQETIDAPTDRKAMEAKVDALAPWQNRFCAFMVRGEFSRIKTRCVPAQTRPYPPMAEVVKSQTVFDLTNVRGTLVGLRCPTFIKGVNVAGYHMHFIADDLSCGGHVLDFEMSHGVLEADTKEDWLHICFPTDSAYFDGVALPTRPNAGGGTKVE